MTTLVFCECNFPNCPRTSFYEASEASFYEASERDFRIEIASRMAAPAPA